MSIDEVDKAAQLPIEERVVHNNWKVRLAAYETIGANVDRASGPEEPELASLGGFMRIILS